MHDKLGGTQNIGQGKGRKKSQKERICRHPQLGRKIITLCLKFFLTPYPNCILEVVELTELRCVNLKMSKYNFYRGQFSQCNFCGGQLSWRNFRGLLFCTFLLQRGYREVLDGRLRGQIVTI